MHSLNFDRVRESFQYRDARKEAVFLRITRDTLKRRRERQQVQKVYELALELSGLTDEQVEAQLSPKSIEQQQVRVYCMCGGGFLGNFAATQPQDFYIDDRVSGLSYSRNQIREEVERLKDLIHGNEVPPLPRFHNCGVF